MSLCDIKRHGILAASKLAIHNSGDQNKLFLDTADIDHIRETIHKFLMGDDKPIKLKEGGDFIQTIYEICELVKAQFPPKRSLKIVQELLQRVGFLLRSTSM